MTYVSSSLLIIGTVLYLLYAMPQVSRVKDRCIGAMILIASGVLVHIGALDKFAYTLNYYTYMTLALLLLLLAVGDMVTYELPVELLIFAYMLGAVVNIFNKDEAWYWHVLYAGIGYGIFYGLGKLLRGGLGNGDAHVIAIITLNLGWTHTLMTILAALVIASLVGIALMVLGGKSKKTVLPFVPFIAMAHFLLLMV